METRLGHKVTLYVPLTREDVYLVASIEALGGGGYTRVLSEGVYDGKAEGVAVYTVYTPLDKPGEIVFAQIQQIVNDLLSVGEKAALVEVDGVAKLYWDVAVR